MLNEYLIVEKTALPDYFIKVVEARRLLESGVYTQVIDAVQAVGISRSTYYKYKDFIFEPSDMSGSRRAVISVMLSHEPGVLSALLRHISDAGASVLTITQSLPINNMASVTISLDVNAMPGSVEELISTISTSPGIDNPRLLAME